ncbi:branched-chain amino acid ABC transporter permease [Enterovirga sp. CN4-39]|uniref:branched-chain amino acid ABC transporter permease n=1 Tax=Enterovirga sp. CN4-39 TaxID=3400910 RepID=UPI003C10E930
MSLFNDYYLNILVMTCLWAGLAGAWNLMAGYGGLVSLGHAAFLGIGAYVTAIAYTKFGLSPWIGLVASIVITSAVAVLISWPCFRLRGAFFSLATLVFPIAMEIVANNWSDMTRGSSGIAIPFRPGLENFMFSSRLAYLIAAALFMLLVYGVARWMHRGRLGLYLVAVRDDQATAASMGVDPLRVKLLITLISAALTAMGGFFYAQYILFIDPPSVFSINNSVQVALLAIIGGLGTPAGPIVGAMIMTPLDGALSQFVGGGPRLLIYGTVLLAVVLLAPQGVVGAIQARRRAQ